MSRFAKTCRAIISAKTHPQEMSLPEKYLPFINLYQREYEFAIKRHIKDKELSFSTLNFHPDVLFAIIVGAQSRLESILGHMNP